MDHPAVLNGDETFCIAETTKVYRVDRGLFYFYVVEEGSKMKVAGFGIDKQRSILTRFSNHEQWVFRFVTQKHSSRIFQPEWLRSNMPVHRLQIADASFQWTVNIERGRPCGRVHGDDGSASDGDAI